MIEKLCKNCDNRICKDMYPTMQKEYIKLCLNSNRSRFIPHKESDGGGKDERNSRIQK